LIVLARGGFLEVLQALAAETIVPSAVASEVRRGALVDAAVAALNSSALLRIVETGPVPDRIRRYGLDAGEEAVLTWAAAHPGTTALIDEHRARRVAVSLNVPILGTLGLVVEAKRRGIIPAARPVIERLLRVTTWYLDEDLRERVLRAEGESWTRTMFDASRASRELQPRPRTMTGLAR